MEKQARFVIFVFLGLMLPHVVWVSTAGAANSLQSTRFSNDTFKSDSLSSNKDARTTTKDVKVSLDKEKPKPVPPTGKAAPFRNDSFKNKKSDLKENIKPDKSAGSLTKSSGFKLDKGKPLKF